MGTCNYISQDNFDLYIIEYEASEEYIKEYEEINECEFNEELDSEIFYEDVYREAKWLADKLSKELMFHYIEIEAGYYTGIQTYVMKCFEDIEQLDNEYCYYYFDMCKSKAIRKYKAEVNKINKKLLPLFKNELGFEHIRCVGVFSNGEAVYERVN